MYERRSDSTANISRASEPSPEAHAIPPRARAALQNTIDSVEEVVNRPPKGTQKEESLPEQSPAPALASVDTPSASNKIALVLNNRVKKWIEYFSKRDRARFQRFLDRGYQYKDVVQTVLEENDLPRELYYLAMVESGYVTHARSHAKAVGVWQFIRETGRRYGLEANDFVDERLDPIRATEAAAKYLTDLYNAFQSWELAMAGYNCGEFRVLRSIMTSKTRDFWEISNLRRLPPETRDYVPKFIAAVIIGRNPERYGFIDPAEKGLESYPSIETVEVPSPVRLSDIARVTGIPLKELKAVNPHLRRGTTPPGVETYDVWVPQALVASVEAKVPKLLRRQVVAKRQVAGNSNPHFHRVRRGENLTLIGKRYQLSAAYLKKINGLSSDRILPGTRLRIAAGSYNRSNVKSYRVHRGDTLTRIASQFDTTVTRLKRANGLRSARIQIGQTLTIPGSIIRYKVKRGDSLERISRRYDVSVVSLKRKNGIRGSRIFVGQWLNIPTSGT